MWIAFPLSWNINHFYLSGEAKKRALCSLLLPCDRMSSPSRTLSWNSLPLAHWFQSIFQAFMCVHFPQTQGLMSPPLEYRSFHQSQNSVCFTHHRFHKPRRTGYWRNKREECPGAQCGWDQRLSAPRVNDFPDTLSSCWRTCMANSQTTAYHRPRRGRFTQFRQNSDFEASRLQGLSWVSHTFCQVALGHHQQEACNFTQQPSGHAWPKCSPLPSTDRELLEGRLDLVRDFPLEPPECQALKMSSV